MLRSLVLACILCFLHGGNADTTFVSFSRRVDTCDPYDRPLMEATSKIIWSYNDQDPVDDTHILQHQDKGIKSVRFFSEDQMPVLPPDTQTLDIKLNNQHILFDTSFLGSTTQYWCSPYKVTGVFNNKRQVIRMEPVIEEQNLQYVHHFLLYQCPYLSDTDLAYQGGCADDNAPANVRGCLVDMVAGWAVGGGATNLPDKIGLPIFNTDGENAYFVLETHYNNPYSVDITDSSGFRLYHTSTLRQYDAGIFSYGQLTNGAFVIPPQQPAYVMDAWCPAECTQANYPAGGINITGVTLHTHLTGRYVSLEHYRNGTELPPIIVDPYYDFNYQEFTPLSQERQVLPGDTLKVRCIFDTTSRVAGTPFGLTTQNEMCLAFVIYYPRLPGAAGEGCAYGDFRGIQPSYNQSAFCGNLTLTNWQGPPNFVPYVAPPCNYTPPPVQYTGPSVVTSLNKSFYNNSAILDENGKYTLYWTIDRENLLFHGAVEVETTGWIGLGISPNGMVGSDVFIGWINDNGAHFADRFASAHALPDSDQYQDFYNVQMGQIVTPPSDEGFSQGAIIGITIGGVASLGIIILLVWYLLRYRKTCGEKYQEMGDGPTDKGAKNDIHMTSTGQV